MLTLPAGRWAWGLEDVSEVVSSKPNGKERKRTRALPLPSQVRGALGKSLREIGGYQLESQQGR